jgi:hypothetical protein
VDPFGLLNIIGGIGGSAVAITGVEGSIGIVVNTKGGLNNIGLTGSLGVGSGLNISSDAYFGIIVGNINNISGRAINSNIVAGPVSLTIITDTNGNVIGGTIGYGPGFPAGLSGTLNNTGVLTLQDILDLILGKLNPKPSPCH